MLPTSPTIEKGGILNMTHKQTDGLTDRGEYKDWEQTLPAVLSG